KVWLEPAEPATASGPTATPSQAGDDAQRRRPHHMEAVGHVIARSGKMNVHDTDRLVVYFKDVAALPGQQLPAAAPAAEPSAAGKPATEAIAPARPGTASKPAATEKPDTSSPFDIQARSIEAFVLRAGDKNELDHIVCEGSVHVL